MKKKTEKADRRKTQPFPAAQPQPKNETRGKTQMSRGLKKWYLDFIDKENRSFFEALFYCVLILLSVFFL